MLNMSLLTPRNVLVIGGIALVARMIAGRFFPSI